MTLVMQHKQMSSTVANRLMEEERGNEDDLQCMYCEEDRRSLVMGVCKVGLMSRWRTPLDLAGGIKSPKESCWC